ncbi:MAG: hypothetical protein WAT09_03675 [Paracoccaceae bacterium]
MIRAALILCLMGLPALADQPQTSGRLSGTKADFAAQLRARIMTTWNIGSLSAAAAQTRVDLRVDFDDVGRVRDVVLVRSTAPTKAATDEAFAAALRAILRVDATGGLGLPADTAKEGLILVFDPATGGLS